MIGSTELLDLFERWGLTYTCERHEAIFNMADSAGLALSLEGARCKNLLLQNKQGQFYLVVTSAEKSLDLVAVAATLGSTRLSFASAEQLKERLGVRPGSLSPLALINDTEKVVRLILDEDLSEEACFLFHPLDSAVTMALSMESFMTLLRIMERETTWTRLAMRLSP